MVNLEQVAVCISFNSRYFVRVIIFEFQIFDNLIEVLFSKLDVMLLEPYPDVFFSDFFGPPKLQYVFKEHSLGLGYPGHDPDCNHGCELYCQVSFLSIGSEGLDGVNQIFIDFLDDGFIHVVKPFDYVVCNAENPTGFQVLNVCQQSLDSLTRGENRASR